MVDGMSVVGRGSQNCGGAVWALRDVEKMKETARKSGIWEAGDGRRE